MKPFPQNLLAVGLTLLVTSIASAADASVARQLEAAGLNVVLDASGTATEVSYKDPRISYGEAEYRLIGSFKGLRVLRLGICKSLTDETLPLLANLTNLEEFSGDSIMLSDDGYRHFTAFPRLQKLSLSHPRGTFTGAGWKHLQALPALRSFSSGGTTTHNDEGIAAIGGFPALRELRFGHAGASAAGVNAALARLPKLTTLGLTQNQAKDEGGVWRPSLTGATLPIIAKMTDLESLSLSEAELGYDTLRALKVLPKLKKLELRCIFISPEDLPKLKGDLPGVVVTYQEPTVLERKNLTKLLGLKPLEIEASAAPKP